MSEITKQDLLDLKSDIKSDLQGELSDLKTELRAEFKGDIDNLRAELRADFRASIASAVELIIGEIGIRSSEVNARFDRQDATFLMYSKQLSAGGKAIAAITEWSAKADADYRDLLSGFTDLRIRLAKIDAGS
jgi:hypothetical protein